MLCAKENLHRAARTPLAHTCPIIVQNSRHMYWNFDDSNFIFPPAGGKTLRGPRTGNCLQMIRQRGSRQPGGKPPTGACRFYGLIVQNNGLIGTRRYMSKMLYWQKRECAVWVVCKDRACFMKTTAIINTVCLELGISKAVMAKKMGMLPSSLYRKLARESMTLEELQKCLNVLGVTIAFSLQFGPTDEKSCKISVNMEAASI